MDQPVKKRTSREEILDLCIPLFARHGYEGVSMRAIAEVVGIKAAALYYHFLDKQSLYMAMMDYVLSNKMEKVLATLDETDHPVLKLERFIAQFVKVLSDNRNLLLLLQRERLDGDEKRLQSVAEQIYGKNFSGLVRVVKEIVPEEDSFLIAQSIAGLVVFHMESLPLKKYLPGWKPIYGKRDYLVMHLCQMMRAMLGVNEIVR